MDHREHEGRLENHFPASLMSREKKTNHEHKNQIHFTPAQFAAGCMLPLVGGAQEPSRTLNGELDTSAVMLVTATGTVDSIDLDKRELTLKGEGGHPVTLTVDQRVKRLNELKPGDTVTAEYFASAASEFRPPMEYERAKPLVLLEETVKVRKEGDPSGVAVRKYRVVATVEGVDRSCRRLRSRGRSESITQCA